MLKLSQETEIKKQPRFGIITAVVIQDPNLSITSKAVYSLLCIFANKNRECYPSIQHLADLLGVTRRTIERAINELKEKEYVRKESKTFILK